MPTQYDFAVFGADGMQGRIVVRDLLERGYRVFCSDLYHVNILRLLKKFPDDRWAFLPNDLHNAEAATHLINESGADIVINCADMEWNMNVYKACLATRTHCVDLGAWIEMTEDQLKLDGAFKKIGRTAITGCGSVPGIGNVMLRYAAKKFDAIHSVDVGFVWDSNQKRFVVPFSMKSILEEFTYSPRLVQNGRWVEKKPLQIVREREYRLIGRQKAFLVQHPELFTFLHYYDRRGLENVRFFAGFPEHSLEKIKTLIEFGFHREKPIIIGGATIAPIDCIGPLFKRMRVPRGYTESENLWVEVSGRKNRKQKTILMECLIPPLKGWEEAGSNIDTGFPAVIMAIMVKDGVIRARGSFSPEGVVPERAFFRELRKKEMAVYQDGRAVN